MSRIRWTKKYKTKTARKPRAKTIAYYEVLLIELGISYEIEKRNKKKNESENEEGKSGGLFNRVLIVTKDGKFDSGLECYCYYRLKQENINFAFQTKIVLQEAIKINKENQYVVNGRVMRTIPAIATIPDFIVNQNGVEWYIDTKGKETQQNRLRFKMLEHKLLTEAKLYKILLPKSAEEVEEVIQRLLTK